MCNFTLNDPPFLDVTQWPLYCKKLSLIALWFDVSVGAPQSECLNPPLLVPGGIRIYFRQGCSARALKPLPNFKGHFGRKRYPYLGICLKIWSHFSHKATDQHHERASTGRCAACFGPLTLKGGLSRWTTIFGCLHGELPKKLEKNGPMFRDIFVKNGTHV